MRLIIDTDIGNDCDDAGALAIMHNLKKIYPFDIAGIFCSKFHIEGAYSIDIINKYYKNECLIGKSNKKDPLYNESNELYTTKLCKETNNVSHVFIDEYSSLMRKILLETKEKIDLIILGPMNAFYDFLLSVENNISGLDLINKNAKHIYVMGGTFLDNPIFFANDYVKSEWNIKTDILAAKYFILNVKCEITFVPFECGLFLTGKNLLKNLVNPVSRCYQFYCNGLRQSWDLVTMYYAISKDTRFINVSLPGIISIDDDGITSFKPQKDGKHYVLSIKNVDELQKIIEKYLY